MSAKLIEYADQHVALGTTPEPIQVTALRPTTDIFTAISRKNLFSVRHTTWVRMFTDIGLSLDRLSRGETSLAVSDLYSRVTELYETHYDAIYRFLIAQGLSPHSAEDVAQDVFVKLFVALSDGKTIDSEQGWLYSVAARSAVDQWRRERHSMWVPLESDERPAEAPACPSADPEAVSIRAQKVQRVAQTFLRLRKEQRMCILLRAQGLRYREIATNLGVSTSTVGGWLADAVEVLRGVADD